jgi:predicted transposase/invertase (TIGR01784 family)
MRYKGNERLSGLIEEISRQEEGIMWAELALKKMNRDKEQWARALWREKRAMDYMDYKLLMKEAREEGLKQGIEEGRKEARREAAKNFKAMGLSVEQIAAAVGLDPEEIKRL